MIGCIRVAGFSSVANGIPRIMAPLMNISIQLPYRR